MSPNLDCRMKRIGMDIPRDPAPWMMVMFIDPDARSDPAMGYRISKRGKQNAQ
jgi:hypothetical protein